MRCYEKSLPGGRFGLRRDHFTGVAAKELQTSERDPSAVPAGFRNSPGKPASRGSEGGEILAQTGPGVLEALLYAAH